MNIDEDTPPRLDKLWDDPYSQVINCYFSLISLSLSLSLSLSVPKKEHYLSYVLLSKLKLWCSDDNDHGLVTFLDNSLKSETSRSLLESRYSEQLTLTYILRDDFDRARYYLNLSLQSVLQVMVMMMVMVMVMMIVMVMVMAMVIIVMMMMVIVMMMMVMVMVIVMVIVMMVMMVMVMVIVMMMMVMTWW